MSSPHTILYLITSTNVGGTEKALFEIIRRLDRKEFSIHVCSLKSPGLFAEKIAAEAEGFYSLNLSESGGLPALLSFVPAMLSLLRLIRRIHPTIIHSFLFRANIMGRIAGRLAKVPIIISSIRVIETNKPFKHLIDGLTSSLTDHYIAVSDAARKFTIKHAKITPDKITTIYNGIDSNEKLKQTSLPWHDFNVKESEKVLALAGRFHRQKGHLILIKALKFLLKEAPHTKTFFLGEGGDEASIKQAVEQYGLSGQVQFMGARADLSNILPQIHIIVLPSLWEGLPNILLEAMAAGRPVVASRIEGIDEVVVDGETGILFDPSDARSLAKALLTLLKDESLAETMGRAGRARVLQIFPIQKTLQETLNLYRYLLGTYNSKKIIPRPNK